MKEYFKCSSYVYRNTQTQYNSLDSITGATSLSPFCFFTRPERHFNNRMQIYVTCSVTEPHVLCSYPHRMSSSLLITNLPSFHHYDQGRHRTLDHTRTWGTCRLTRATSRSTGTQHQHKRKICGALCIHWANYCHANRRAIFISSVAAKRRGVIRVSAPTAFQRYDTCPKR